MKLLTSIDELRAARSNWLRDGESVALVPTMGNLHAGHLSLVEQAKAAAQRVIVSIFVNPLQFAPGEDFDQYPRTLDDDLQRLQAATPDVVFAPATETLYPDGHPIATQVVVGEMAHQFCGEFRQGHFVGAATVVNLLLNLTTPDVAIFGQKDYQQLLIFQRMAADLHIPTDIRGGATLREPDGLAMSSRNRYLSDEERERAPLLNACLCDAAALLADGERDFAAIEAAATARLLEAGFQPQFFRVLSPALTEPESAADDFALIAAAILGRARLIDNVQVRGGRLFANGA